MNPALKAPLVPKATRETQEPPGQLALQGHKVPRALTVRKETKVTRAIPELLVPRVSPVQLVLRVLPALKGLRAFKGRPVR